MRAGGLLVVVALVLTGIGAAIIWTADSDVDDPGVFRAEQLTSFCESVDASVLDEWELTEDSRQPGRAESGGVPRFTCAVTLLADEESTSYLAITINADARVQQTIGDAAEAFEGALDYESSKGREVEELSGVGDQAGMVTVVQAEEQQEYRAHIQRSNALLSVSVVVSGTAMSSEQARDAVVTIGESTLDVMGSE